MIVTNSVACTGCAACQNVCPNKCIVMKEDKEGFQYPNIDFEACVGCNLCEKVCPIGKKIEDKNYAFIPMTYACYALDENERENSATGGVAYLCSRFIIENKGVVFGAVGNVLEKVYHTKAENLQELQKIRNSKYLQSEIGYSYRQVKEELELGRLVLFSGTPCQIAGLYGFLGKEYENLYTIDLICHGVPSKMVFQKYIKEVEEQEKQKVVRFYRDKSKGWKPTYFTYVFANGKKDSMHGMNSDFYRAFVTNIITRKSCQKCVYAQMPRVADMSIGDYMDDKKAATYDAENKGLSLVSINSRKGEKLFDSIEGLLFYQNVPVTEAIDESEHLAKTPKANIFRRTFFSLIERKSFFQTTKIMLPKNALHRNIRRIYGMFCYAYEFIKRS